MAYSETNVGRVREQASEAGRVFFTFDDVEQLLVEGLRLWRRAPDRERGWLTVRAYWPEILRHGFFGDGDGLVNHADKDAAPRPLPLTRDQVAEMERAGDLLRHVPERDRRLVVLAIAERAKAGDDDGARIPWLRLWNRLGRGRPGPEGLRKRYARALQGIAERLSK